MDEVIERWGGAREWVWVIERWGGTGWVEQGRIVKRVGGAGGWRL